MRDAVGVREQRAGARDRREIGRIAALDDLRERVVFFDDHDHVRRPRNVPACAPPANVLTATPARPQELPDHRSPSK